MKRVLLFLLLLCLFSSKIFSQNWNRLFMLQEEAQYFMAYMQYEEAADIYIRMLRELPGSSNLEFMTGYAYLNANGKLKEAISCLEKASANVSIDSDPGSLRDDPAPVDCFLMLGTAYQRNKQFDKAEDAYNRYKEMLPADDNGQMIADQYLRSIDNARFHMERPLTVEKRNLGRGINSSESNVNAVLSGDGQTMAYTSITRRGFEVYVVKKTGDSWGKPILINAQLRMDYLLTSSLSYDGSELYLVYYVPERSDIYHSEFEDGEWGKARRLRRPVRSRSNETHASVSADGQTLYFTSNRDGEHGELNIYRATLNRRGRWKDVEKLGPEINTQYNEETPFVTADDNYLFFSSEGHNSMGGYDVFYVDLNNLSQAHNLGYPLNNTGDNLFYFPAGDGREGYISLYDEDGFGKKDIYQVTLIDEEPSLAEQDTDVSGEGRSDLKVSDDATEPAGPGESDETFEPAGISATAGRPVAASIPETNGILPPVADTVLPADPSAETAVTSVYYAEEAPEEAISYSVQYMALEKEIEWQMMDRHAGHGNYVQYGTDGFSRFIAGFYNTRQEALKIRDNYLEMGYADAFIHENNFTPNYTIQLAATNNLLKINYFNDLSDIIIMAVDGPYKYSWGSFSTYEEAASHIERIRSMGYTDAFIRKM